MSLYRHALSWMKHEKKKKHRRNLIYVSLLQIFV